MNTPSTTTNVVTGIFAALFSIFFVISFITTSLLWSVASIMTPDGLADFMTSDHLTEFIISSPDMADMLEENGMPKEAVAGLLGSDFADEVLSSFADGISAEILGTESNTAYDEEYFKELCLENKDEIIAFLETFPEAEDLSKEEMDEVFNNFAEDIPAQLANGITEAAVSLQEEGNADYAEYYHIFADILPVIVTVLTIVLLVICWLLRIKFTYGLLWTGILNAVAGVLSLCNSVLIGLSAESLSQMGDIPFISPIFSAVSEKMTLISLIPLLLGIALIVTKILITKAKNNKDETNESYIRD